MKCTVASRVLTLCLLLSPVRALAQATQTFTNTPSQGGIRGLHLDRPATDTLPHGIVWDYAATFAWASGLDATLGYTYPSGTVPDLVLAYSKITDADNLRLRADDARMELGPSVGHPTTPFQLSITAGTPTAQLGGVGIGAYDYQYQLYLYNRSVTTRRTQMNFYNCFGLITDINQNGTRDFELYNYSTSLPVFTVTAATDFCLKAPKAGFFSATPVAKPTVTGSRASGAALTSLLSAMAQLGLITDSTTP